MNSGNIFTTIQQSLEKYGAQLVTMFGSINPYLGAGVGLLLLVGLIYLGFRAKKWAWEDAKNQSGSTVGGEVGNDQNTTKPVLDSGDDFFGDGGKGATGAAASGVTGVGK